MSRVERGLPNRDRKGDGAFANFFTDSRGRGSVTGACPLAYARGYNSRKATDDSTLALRVGEGTNISRPLRVVGYFEFFGGLFGAARKPPNGR
jgi:hypothetical protein